ncbi:hypothetical protein [Streptomyces sp. NPDC056144]|uniref:hypothetical protein n=1 Tax=unclassified Streptomyces TaxID=2593676 RepID=UPI0035E1C35F
MTSRTANHRRAVAKVAGLHGKVRRRRLDHAHKRTSALGRRSLAGGVALGIQTGTLLWSVFPLVGGPPS